MTSTLVFWLVLAAASLVMLGATRLILYGLKPGRRPILRIVLAHLFALALLTLIAGYDMPFLAGPVRWGYALGLLGFGTLPWLAMDIVRLRLKSEQVAPRRHPTPALRADPPHRGEG